MECIENALQVLSIFLLNRLNNRFQEKLIDDNRTNSIFLSIFAAFFIGFLINFQEING